MTDLTPDELTQFASAVHDRITACEQACIIEIKNLAALHERSSTAPLVNEIAALKAEIAAIKQRLTNAGH